MSSVIGISVPLLAGFLYALGALFSKRGFIEGVGLTRTLFLGNLMMGLLIGPVGFLAGEQPDMRYWYAPLLCAFLFSLGQLFTFLAIRVGDISVMTPVMGTKVIMVALGAALFFQVPLGIWQWVGAGLTTVAIFLLGFSGFGKARGTLTAIVFALMGSTCYGFTDSMVAVWAAEFGELKFLSFMFLYLALFSYLLVPLFQAPLRAISRQAWPWVLASSFLLGFQALLMGLVLAYFQEATITNILYSSRGLWGLVLVAVAAAWFGVPEARLGRRLFLFRAAGAVLLTIAIMMVLLLGV